MKLIGTMPVRNEAWILGLSARVALTWCDELVILNHASTDATVDIIADLQREECGRVHLISIPEDAWNEMQHREMMLDLARGKGATHIGIVDADEILTANLHIAHEALSPGEIMEIPGYNLRGGMYRYHVNGTWGQRWFSTVFKDHERLHWSTWTKDAYEHHQRTPKGLPLIQVMPINQGRGGTLHFWGANERRLRAKHALYKMSERVRYPDRNRLEIDAMYSWWKTGMSAWEPFNWQFADVPPEWWKPYEGLMKKYLDLEAYPWQEAQCKALWDKHGAETFKGLDLFGVI